MDVEVKKQIDRVTILSEMIKDRLIDFENDILDKVKWIHENPYKETWECPKPNKTTPTEIKRLMLVQRQEMIKLEKML